MDNTDTAGTEGESTRDSALSCGLIELTVLTDEAEQCKERSENPELDSMSEDPRLEQAFALIRAVVAEQGDRAVDAFINGLRSQGAIKSGETVERRVTRHPDAEKSQRAPAGSARVLCKRALGQAGDAGLTIKKIQDQATGEYEKMLSTSAIRNELGVGSTNLTPPLYKQVGGVWYLAADIRDE